MRAKRLLPCVALLALLLSAGAWAETEDKTEQEPAGYVALTFDDGPSGALTRDCWMACGSVGPKQRFSSADIEWSSIRMRWNDIWRRDMSWECILRCTRISRS